MGKKKKNKKYSDKYEDFNISEKLDKLLRKRRTSKEVKTIWREDK